MNFRLGAESRKRTDNHGLPAAGRTAPGRLFSLALILVLLALPLLAGEYFYLHFHFKPNPLQVVLWSEIVFSLIWCSMAMYLGRAFRGAGQHSRLPGKLVTLAVPVLAISVIFSLSRGSGLKFLESAAVLKIYSSAYFASFFMLLSVLYVSWRLEHFWGSLNKAQRWEYKTLISGNLLISGTFAWSASYRLTCLRIIPDHILLAAVLLLGGWIMMLYAVLHHRLLNRKFFVSRKIVATFAIPSLLAAYLVIFGIIALLMRTFSLEMDFVVKWLLIASGIITAMALAFSRKIRRRIHFYISTHFYVNKYEYRDEWLALSEELQGALSEKEVVNALHKVLSESLYTNGIYIWLGNPDKGYTLFSTPDNPGEPGCLPAPRRAGTEKKVSDFSAGLSDLQKKHFQIHTTLTIDDPLVPYLQSHPFFDLNEKDPDTAWHGVHQTDGKLFTALELKLLSPVTAGNQLIGLIGLGPEYTGGQYGHDDFDLLTVLGSQTASALLAVQMADKLAHARERQAWNRLSAFVLHDIKNAATMLSMLRENAPEHIHEPEFQQDMLELVDDALRRMGRVEQRLLTLKDEITPRFEDIELCSALHTCCRQMQVKLPGVNIELHCTGELPVKSDRELLFSILENILLNGFQAGGNSIHLNVNKDTARKQIEVEISDNGEGIAEELLPHALFAPFKTLKKVGSGIGLWQVQRMVTSLGGSISAANNPAGGARFTIILPGG